MNADQQVALKQQEQIENLRQECWTKAIYSFGTGYIFEQRYNKARRRLRLLDFFAIAVPLIVGGLVIAFFEFDSVRLYLSGLIVIGAILGTLQIVFTLWSIVYKWDEIALYAGESQSDNKKIANQYEKLAKNPPENFQAKLELLIAGDDFRSELDAKQGISSKEERMGLKAGLRRYERKCKECGVVPINLKSTNCPLCGNY